MGHAGALGTQVPSAAIRQQNLVARIERLPFHRWHVKMRLIVGTATFFDGLDSMIISYILPVLIPLWHLKPTQIGFLISSAYVGQLIGSLFFGWYAEKLGRRRSLTITVAIFAVASLLCMFSWAYSVLMILRFVQGWGLGGEMPVAATYINELAKAKGRGKFVLLYELVFTIGLVLAALIGWSVIPRFGWRVMFLIGALVGGIIPFIRRSLPESPRWLAGQSRFDEAEAIVTKIEDQVSEHGRRELPPVEVTFEAAELKPARWAELLQGIYLRRSFTVWVIWFATFFCNFGLFAWLPSLYTSIFKLPLKLALRYSLLTQIVGLIAGVCCVFLIDQIGRKKLFTGAFAGLCISMFLLLAYGRNSLEAMIVLSSCACFFVSCNSISLWVYTPELYPTRMRALGCGVGTAWYRVAVILAPTLVGLIISRYSLSYVFLMFGVVSGLGAIITGAFAVETKGRILEEVSP
ncbi:MAG: MFS transporter [Candidatus Korobacteraceae bacterium]|jgi:putative MFS transporter